MITRRQFFKSAGILALALSLPLPFARRELQAALFDNINYKEPPVLPQIIHVFLYGGPSELAGNLTNIAQINANSQNMYPSGLDPDNVDNDITTNNFWGQAGGDIMEQLLADKYLSLYRTINRIKDDSKAHGRSVTQNLVGNLDLSSPGIATTLAKILDTYNPYGKGIDEMVLPFVSLEGESTVFNLGNLTIPQVMRPVTLDSNFKNPYSRSRNWYVDPEEDDETNSIRLDQLARSVSGGFNSKYGKVNEAFSKRAELEEFISSRFNIDSVDADLPIDPVSGQPIQYPDNNFGDRLKSAVSLAIGNPDTVFISLGSGGLGGWDDHSDALEDYPSRMNGLMAALQVACRHMELKSADNIVINVFGDFGRNVNLNNSGGWDHGNNQNLYTLGGWGIPGRALGKLVGKTRRIGESKQNRQFTSPTSGSYQCEPFSIASTIFKYFGVQNPQVLTGEPAINESSKVPNEWV
jgi:hypothetical protein